MTTSKNPRARALAALKRLGGPRSTKESLPHEVLHFGIHPDIKRERYEDRSIVLVTGAAIEQGLESLMLAKFIALNDNEERQLFSEEYAPLGSFDAKIRLAYAMGLIGARARDDLVYIKAIRNAFAHSRLDINFDTPEVSAIVEFLGLPSRLPQFFFDLKTARDRFMQCGWHYLGALLLRSPPDEKEPTAFFGVVLDTFRTSDETPP